MRNSTRLNLNVALVAVISGLLVAAAFETTNASQTYDMPIDGERFRLEIAADVQSRSLGLGGRESIEANGGMLFVFPNAKIRSFFMRDCTIPIDIVFLDDIGVITALYTMEPEAPRGRTESNTAYERRLKRYSSLARSPYAIELRAGTIHRLGLTQGERVSLDTQRIKTFLR